MVADRSTSVPPGRYQRERRSRSSRTWIWLGTAAAVAVGLGVAYLGYHNLAATPVDGQQTGYVIDDAATLTLRFDVTRDDPSKPAVCILRARSADGAESGRREVYVAASTSTISSLSAPIHTSSPPVAGDVYGCSLTVPPWFPSP